MAQVMALRESQKFQLKLLQSSGVGVADNIDPSELEARETPSRKGKHLNDA